MIQYSDRGKVRIKDLIWYSIVAFPLTSTIKVYVGPLNLILTILLFGLFFYNYYRTQMFKSEFLLCFYAVLGVLVNVAINGFHFFQYEHGFLLSLFDFILSFFYIPSRRFYSVYEKS